MIDYLVKMGGIPAEVAANRDLMNIFLPAIRGDYTVRATRPPTFPYRQSSQSTS